VADSSQPQITVETGASGTSCWVTIRDNGPGIPPQILERVFEPFVTTKPIGKGTGLGLAISYKLIEKQGGRIEVDTKPGQGTAMRVVLPILAGSRSKVGSDAPRQ